MSEPKANQDKPQNSPTKQLEADSAPIANKPAYIVRREIRAGVIDALLKITKGEEKADPQKIKAIQTLARIVGIDKAGMYVRRRSKPAPKGEKFTHSESPSGRLDQLTGALQ